MSATGPTTPGAYIGPPGPPKHKHDNGMTCWWVRRVGTESWQVVNEVGDDLGPCPGLDTPSETCSRCGRHRPHGCLCHIPITRPAPLAEPDSGRVRFHKSVGNDTVAMEDICPPDTLDPSAPEPVQTQETLAGLADVLWQHLPMNPDRCICGYYPTDPRDYHRHKATAILDAGWVSPADHARALTEAWDQGVIWTTRFEKWRTAAVLTHNPFRKGDADE